MVRFYNFVKSGDWEFPVYFIVYWDGRRLRGYVPTDGNPWNTSTKQAYGNNEKSDTKNARKRCPERYEDVEGEILSDDFQFDGEAIKKDILNRIMSR